MLCTYHIIVVLPFLPLEIEEVRSVYVHLNADGCIALVIERVLCPLSFLVSSLAAFALQLLYVQTPKSVLA